jgi:hypothetical protein
MYHRVRSILERAPSPSVLPERRGCAKILSGILADQIALVVIEERRALEALSDGGSAGREGLICFLLVRE